MRRSFRRSSGVRAACSMYTSEVNSPIRRSSPIDGPVRVDALEVDRVHACPPVHPRGAVGLGDEQQVAALDALAQTRGHLREWPAGGVGGALLVAQDPASRARDQLERRPLGPLHDRVVARAEEDEVMLAQPFEEGDGLVDLLLAVARSGAARGIDHASDHARHLRVVAHGEAQLAQREGDLLAKRLRTFCVQPFDQLDPHDRLARGCSARAADAQDGTVGSPLDPEDRMQQRPHREPLGRDRAADGIDQERRVGGIRLEHRRAVRSLAHIHGDGLAPGVDEALEIADPGEQLRGRHSLEQLARRAAQQAACEGFERIPIGRGRLLREQAHDLVGNGDDGLAHVTSTVVDTPRAGA